jgi:hypothetical protein
VQCAAVRTTCGAMSVPEQNHPFLPLPLSFVSAPTFG